MSGMLSRQLVRAHPSLAQRTFVGETVAPNGVLQADFEISEVLCDRGQLNGTNATSGLTTVGPYLDVSVYSDSVGQIDVVISVDGGTAVAASMLAAPVAVAAAQFAIISQLRIPARYVSVQFTNLAVGAATVDFGAYMRSN